MKRSDSKVLLNLATSDVKHNAVLASLLRYMKNLLSRIIYLSRTPPCDETKIPNRISLISNELTVIFIELTHCLLRVLRVICINQILLRSAKIIAMRSRQ